MRDIIKWVNDKTNRKLISWILILSGLASIVTAIFSYITFFTFPSYDSDIVNIFISSLAVGVFQALFGVILLILGIRLYKSIKVIK